MIKLIRRIALVLTLLLSAIVSANTPEQKELQTCTKIATKIEHLDDLRRSGGSAKQMDTWKRKRHQLSDQAYHLNCKRFGILHK